MKRQQDIESLTWKQTLLNDAIPCNYCGCFVLSSKIINVMGKAYCRRCFEKVRPELIKELSDYDPDE